MFGYPHPVLSMLVVLTLVGVSSPGFAQLVVDRWTTENGLPQNSVNDILQTRDRYMWFATHGGLVRFDGVRFVVFDRSVEGIGSQRLMALHEDREGTLWAASDNGMLIRYRDGRFITYGDAEDLPNGNVARIEENEDGAIWVTWAGRVTRYDGRGFETYAPNHFADEVSAPPPDQYLYAWWSEDPRGLRALVRGRVRTYSIRQSKNRPPITRVQQDRDGNVWISTAGGGVVRAWDGGHERYTQHEGLPTDHPRGFFARGRDGAVWFVDGRARAVFRIRNGHRERLAVPDALAHEPRSFYVDDEGSAWFGTTASGVFRIHDAPITLHQELDGITLRVAYGILQDRNGAVWISTGGLQKYVNGRVTVYSIVEGPAADRVTCMYEDRSGRLWVGTYAGVTYVSDDRLRAYEDTSGFLGGPIWSILQDRGGSFWFATERGLVRSSGTEVTRYTTANGLSHDRITSLFEDRSGVLWIGTSQGLTRFDGERFTAFTEREGVIGNAVRAFHEDTDGHLWFGTYDGGLYRLTNQRVSRFTRADGLFDDGVFQILEDADGYFWMGSNRGIQRVSRRELNEFADGKRRSVTAVAFGARDGLASVEVNGGRQPAGLRAADGKLWFPTMAGVAIIDPALFRTPPPPPRAIIEEFRLDGEAVAVESPVRVHPRALAFDIRYTAPNFVRPEQVRFRYRLAGFHEEWVEVGNRREASFYGIRPGQYRFEVAAADRNGIWNTSGASLHIAVLPPYWRTWWFYSLMIAAVVSLAVAAHQIRVRRLRRLQALHEMFSRRLIDSQESERRRISNEMHDSLGQDLRVIKKLARSGYQPGTPGRDSVDVLAEIESVAERVQSEMTEIAYGLRPHQLDNIGLSKTLESMIRRVGKACDIEFVAEISSIDHLLPADAHIHVFRIVQEAVSNVIEHSQASAAKVLIQSEHRQIRIVLEDNGNGVSADPHGALDAMNGFGLMGIRERAHILGGRLEIRSAARVGTVLTVTIPLERAGHA